MPALAEAERINRTIIVVRGERVMLDTDLAQIYGVSTRALVQAVKRNRSRFPRDFMFALTGDEARNLRSQTVISRGLDRPTIRFALMATRSSRRDDSAHLPDRAFAASHSKGIRRRSYQSDRNRNSDEERK
jgi:hypothetical protein